MRLLNELEQLQPCYAKPADLAIQTGIGACALQGLSEVMGCAQSGGDVWQLIFDDLMSRTVIQLVVDQDLLLEGFAKLEDCDSMIVTLMNST